MLLPTEVLLKHFGVHLPSSHTVLAPTCFGQVSPGEGGALAAKSVSISYHTQGSIKVPIPTVAFYSLLSDAVGQPNLLLLLECLVAYALVGVRSPLATFSTYTVKQYKTKEQAMYL